MNSLKYPLWQKIIGNIAGYSVYLVLNIVFRLPNSLIALKFRFIKAILSGIMGNTSEMRVMSDLHLIFSKGGEGATVIKKVITRSRPEELIDIVRGSIIRSI